MHKWWQQIKKYWWPGIIAVLIVFCFGPYMRLGLPVTHDGENHVARFAQYYLALRQGQVPPRLGPTLENGYGYPVFNFNYPLSNILSVPLIAVRLHPELVFKILAVGYVCLGAWSWWQWQKARGMKRAALGWSTLAYVWAPYLYNSIWYRGNIGEIAAWALVPLVAWQIERCREDKAWAWSTLTISLAAFCLCHNIFVMLMIPCLFGYALVRMRGMTEKKRFGQLLGAFGLAVAVTLWFWLPALVEKKLTVLDGAGLNQEYLLHFPTLSQLLSFNYSGGLSYPGRIDGLSLGAGLVLVLTLGVASVKTLLCRCNRQSLTTKIVVID